MDSDLQDLLLDDDDDFQLTEQVLKSISTTAGQEYPQLFKATNRSFELDTRLQIVLQDLRMAYAPYFPELDRLVTDHEYPRVVGQLLSTNSIEGLTGLSAATMMVISVTLSQRTLPISEDLIVKVQALIDDYTTLEQEQQGLLVYIESCTSDLTPNLVAIIGPMLSAKLLSLAGGLAQLAIIPSCNIQVLGRQETSLLGASRVASTQHHGVIYTCALVADVHDTIKRQAARILSGKVALASRIDFAKQSLDGKIGREYLADIQQKIKTLQDPPPGKKSKALKAPDMETKKRRGGKRYMNVTRARAAKLRNGVSDLRKAQNRMVFGGVEEEVGFGDETVGLGTVGLGSVRKLAIKSSGMRVSKKHLQHGGNKSVSGSASVAFTPVGIQFIEPVLPKVKEMNKYFSGFKNT